MGLGGLLAKPLYWLGAWIHDNPIRTVGVTIAVVGSFGIVRSLDLLVVTGGTVVANTVAPPEVVAVVVERPAYGLAVVVGLGLVFWLD